MQEFSSVTASSYDADSLTPLLNEKAAEGWDVVSIVSAGTVASMISCTAVCNNSPPLKTLTTQATSADQASALS